MKQTHGPAFSPELKHVPPKNLRANPHNPRLLFDKDPMRVLEASIAKVGILVPLTVYMERGRSGYVILDGQRRWTCALKLNLPTVPVNQVAEPTLVENIVTMFQIHKLREDWELMPTALKLDLLMTEMKESRDEPLAKLTGLDVAVVTRCKKLLSYPRKYQEMMLDPDPANRQKADFFIELYAVRRDREVRKMEWFEPDPFTDRMLEKFNKKAGGLKAVTDFRRIKQAINNAAKAGRHATISKRLHAFTEDDGVDIETLFLDEAKAREQANRVLLTTRALEKLLADFDVEAVYGETELWENLERLDKRIQELLSQAGRRPRR